MIPRMRGTRASFWQDADLYDLEEATKLPLRTALAALHNWSDREGRFEWKPRELKLNILPFDKLDCADVLNALQKGNFVQRYDVGGRSYGVINPELWRQQNINSKEAQSDLPAPPADVMARFQHGALTSGFHSYRDQPESATVTASTPADTGEHMPTYVDTGEGKGREGNRTEGNGTQHPEAGDADVDRGRGDPGADRADDLTSTVQEPVGPAILLREGDPVGIVASNGDRPQGRKLARLPAIVGRKTQVAIITRLGIVASELQSGTRERLLKDDLRTLQAEVVFSYWIAKTGYDADRTIFDEDRERRIVKALKMNDGDVSELLYAIDGSFKDKHLQGENDRSRKYDGIETIFRDRAMIERLARHMPGYRNKVVHPIVEKYAQAISGERIEQQETGGTDR